MVGTSGDARVVSLGGKYASIQLSVLTDLPVDDLVKAPINYMNGRDDDWQHEPKEHRQL